MTKRDLEQKIESLEVKLNDAHNLIRIQKGAIEMADGENQEARGLLKKHASVDVYDDFCERRDKAKKEWAKTIKIEFRKKG